MLEDLGEQLVKNIAHPVRAFRLRISETQDAEALVVDEPVHVLAEEENDASDKVALELALWDSVKDGGSDELASYLEHYPEGTFASLARTRQAVLAEAGHADERAADLDAAFWGAIKDTQTDEELAAYLERHPAGHFASLARARIGQGDPVPPRIEAEGDASEQAIELAFWAEVSDTDDPALLDAYLEKFPDGEFAILARAPRATVLPNGALTLAYLLRVGVGWLLETGLPKILASAPPNPLGGFQIQFGVAEPFSADAAPGGDLRGAGMLRPVHLHPAD